LAFSQGAGLTTNGVIPLRTSGQRALPNLPPLSKTRCPVTGVDQFAIPQNRRSAGNKKMLSGSIHLKADTLELLY